MGDEGLHNRSGELDYLLQQLGLRDLLALSRTGHGWHRAALAWLATTPSLELTACSRSALQYIVLRCPRLHGLQLRIETSRQTDLSPLSLNPLPLLTALELRTLR
jgi:hypothetical protein